MKKLVIIGVSLGLVIVIIGALAGMINDRQPKMNEVPIQQVTEFDFTKAQNKITDYLHEINGNGYIINSIDFPDQQKIQDGWMLVNTDVIMEKEGLYDWLRLQVILENEEIVSIKRVDIPYYERVTQFDRLPADSEETIRKALESISSEDRDLFGINFRSYQLGSDGIENVEVTSISAVAANEDLTELLAKASVKISLFDHVREGEHLVYLRKYAHTKWQVEDIHTITKGGF